MIPSVYHQSVLFEKTVEYDCFRAAAYRYFNILPKFNENGSLLITHLRTRKEHHLRLEDFDIRQRSIITDDRSTREIVLLFCNSDVVIRSWVPDDYFPLFLLPRSAYIEIDENHQSQSWLDANWELMRIFYYRHNSYDKELNSIIEKAVTKVKKKKYAYLSSSGQHGCVTCSK